MVKQLMRCIHDHVHPHFACVTQKFESEYHLFLHMKHHLRGKRLVSDYKTNVYLEYALSLIPNKICTFFLYSLLRDVYMQEVKFEHAYMCNYFLSVCKKV